MPQLRLPPSSPLTFLSTPLLSHPRVIQCAADPLPPTTLPQFQRLLPILANLPCAVTLLDLDSGPVYQNGPSLRSVPRDP